MTATEVLRSLLQRGSRLLYPFFKSCFSYFSNMPESINKSIVTPKGLIEFRFEALDAKGAIIISTGLLFAPVNVG
jgi:hypothetical protein